MSDEKPVTRRNLRGATEDAIALFDAVSYVGRWPRENLAYHSIEGLRAEMDRIGINRAMVCHMLAWLNSPEVGNNLLSEEIAGDSRFEACWILKPGPNLMSRKDIESLFAQMVDKRVRAVRFFPRDHVYPLSDWMVRDLFVELNNRRFLVFMDLDQVFLQSGLYSYDPNGLRNLAWLCQTYPDISLVLTRIGYRAYQSLVPLMRDCPNLHFDLSYFATHQGVEDIASRFGAERMLFGTSQPLADAGGALTRLMYAQITRAQCEMIAHGNIERLLARVSQPGPERPAPSGQVLSGETDELYHLSSMAHAGQVLSSSGIEIIDAHGHLGPYYKLCIPDNDAEGLIRVLDRCGISRASISSHMAISADWRQGNRVTADAVGRYPDRLIGQVVASPHEPEKIKDELRRAFDEWGFHAIKLHPDEHEYPIGGDGYDPVWDFATERRCLVLSHTYHGSKFDDPQAFGSLAALHPDVTFLLVHSGALTAGFPAVIDLAREHPNLYIDISGSFITGAWIRKFVCELGAQRVVFSSDIPFIDLRYSLGRVLFAGLNSFELEAILGRNIRYLYGLSTTS